MHIAYLLGCGFGTAIFPAIAHLICAVLINAGRSAMKQNKIVSPIKISGLSFIVFFFIGFTLGNIPRSGNMVIGGLIVVPFVLSLMYYLFCVIRAK